MYYLYRHIRLDKNEVFYIGIGTINNEKYYRRAFLRANRSDLWTNIKNKTKYKVDIILENESLNFIKQKEIEFIKLYGRIDLKTGSLANLTDGGDGGVNWKPTKEQLEKMSESHKGEKNGFYGKKHTEETKLKMEINRRSNVKENNPFYGKKHSEESIAKMRNSQIGKIVSLKTKIKISSPVINKNTKEEYYSIGEAAEKIKIPYSTLYAKLKGKLKNNTELILKNG
jgi:group I intron endonuclease